MGCTSSNEKYKEELIKISKISEVDMKYLIEQIIIATNFNEKDIFYLYGKFKKLEPNAEGFISNSQLLELPEFKYCPFRKHLTRVFKLEPDPQDVTEEEREESEEEEDEQKKEMEEDSDFSKEEENKVQPQVNIDLKKTKKVFWDKNRYNYDNIPHNKNAININNDPKNNNYINQRGIEIVRPNTYIQTPIKIGRQYINFKKFCEVMKPFNSKSEVDIKIKCKP